MQKLMGTLLLVGLIACGSNNGTESSAASPGSAHGTVGDISVNVVDAVFETTVFDSNAYMAIVLTDVAKICSVVEASGESPQSGHAVVLEVVTAGASVAKGTYAIDGFTNVAEIGSFGPDSIDVSSASSGSITITSVTSTTVTGSYSAIFDSNATVTGTFSASYCSALENVDDDGGDGNGAMVTCSPNSTVTGSGTISGADATTYDLPSVADVTFVSTADSNDNFYLLSILASGASGICSNLNEALVDDCNPAAGILEIIITDTNPIAAGTYDVDSDTDGTGSVDASLYGFTNGQSSDTTSQTGTVTLTTVTATGVEGSYQFTMADGSTLSGTFYKVTGPCSGYMPGATFSHQPG